MRHRIYQVTVAMAALLLVSAFVSQRSIYAYHSYQLTVSQLKAGLDKASNPKAKGFFLIDVRSPREHATGMIPGTDLNIDFREIGARHQELSAKPDDHIVVYCQSGKRSNVAAETLADLGYKNVYNVRGSMNAWVEAGFPVVPAKGR
jgi:phage shock protein E